MHHYSGLGAVGASDPLMARTRLAARTVLKKVEREAPGDKLAELNRGLAAFDPSLPGKLQRVFAHLVERGRDPNAALEEALARTLADSIIERYKLVGQAALRGQRLSVDTVTSISGLAGLGSVGSDIAKFFGSVARSTACSDGVRSLTTDLVGRSEGRGAATATDVGFEVTRGVTRCRQPGAGPAAPGAPFPTEEPRRFPWTPVLIGVGALAVVGGVVFVAARKKKSASA